MNPRGRTTIRLASLILLLAFWVSSCLQKGEKHEVSEDDSGPPTNVKVTLGSQNEKTGRYVGTYEEVTGVLLTYSRSDGLGDNQTVVLTQVTTDFGGSTPVTQWTGTLENVIPGANYNFEALASADYSTLCDPLDAIYQTQEFYDLPWEQQEPFYSICRPTLEIAPLGNFVKNVFNGTAENFKIQAGNNALQLRMEPIIKPAADNQMIPYITKIDRPSTYAGGEQIDLKVEFKGPQGFPVMVDGRVTASCTVEAEADGLCNSINENLWGYPMRICPRKEDGTENWNCDANDNVTVTTFRIFNYSIPTNPPDQIRIEFTLGLSDLDWNPLGLSNSIWFTINRNSLDQASELVFMPTVQDISVYYDMSSENADLSYALQTMGLTDDIEIYANLNYEGSTPLGFPSPYLRIVNTGTGSGVQTLYGRMDKNELYEATLKLNFVHTPTGFSYASTYPLPANDKPKFGKPAENWLSFRTTGLCTHCYLENLGQYSEPADWDESISGVWQEYSTSYRTGEPWVENTNYPNGGYWTHIQDGFLNMDGGNLEYTNFSNGQVYGAHLKNTNFLGTNLYNTEFYDMDLTGSQFINSQIYNTKIWDTILDNAIFTSDDGLDTTQNLPYTSLHIELSRGDNIQFNELTTKLLIKDTEFRNLSMNNNLIYQSSFDSFNAYGEFKNNDVVETTIQNSNWENLDLADTSFVTTSLAFVSLLNSDLSKTWFDKASGTTLYLVSCDETTILPIYGNTRCRDDGYLEFLEDANQEFVLDLPSGKNRASYLYEGDADSFRLLVQDPASVAIEVSSKDPNVNFVLRKSGQTGTVALTDSGLRTTVRDDGTYTTTWKYFSDLEPVSDSEYYFVQVSGFEGVYYAVSYYAEK
jgi:uncharacterized protein YjbI with pentapeptide repeats